MTATNHSFDNNHKSTIGGRPEEEEESSKCAQCSRKARRGCTRSLCFRCCTDEDCTVHREQREQALFREKVWKGTTDEQLALRHKQSKKIPRGRFRESGFVYMGDTVVLWNLREYLADPKRKEDALRKSSKRRERSSQPSRKTLRTSRKRFRTIVEDLYQQSLLVCVREPATTTTNPVAAS